MSASQPAASRTITLPEVQRMHEQSHKIAALTCYDASFAQVLNAAGIEVLLVGDSLGNVLQGHATTLPVSIQDMVYHTHCVARGNSRALLMADLPFGTYATPQDALTHAVQLMRAGAHIVKLEGGAWLAETVHMLKQRGIPVCVHLGLTPQSVHMLGGFKMQAKEPAQAQKLLEEAHILRDAGAHMFVLEAVPAKLAEEVTRTVQRPTIGIGAGPHCSGQILVLHDLLGLSAHPPRFSKDFLAGQNGIAAAVVAYVQAVKEGSFPEARHWV